MRVDLALAAVGLALLVPLQRGLDAYPLQEATLLTTLPPRRLLPALACGQGGTAADLLEIRATNYLFGSLQPGRRMDPEQLIRFYDAIVTLDPYDPDAVVRGALYLSTMADRPDRAITMLKAAIARIPPQQPRRWVLYFELVAINLTTLPWHDQAQRQENVRRAGELLLEISTLPGVPHPETYRKFGERLISRGLNARESLQRQEALWESRSQSGEPALRREALERLNEARCALVRLHLQRALAAFRKQVGRLPTNLGELRQDLTDPLGVGFYLSGGQVVAPGYEARQLERALVPRHRAWVEAHPGQVPTAADLGLEHVPPYLHLELTRDGVRVEARVARPNGARLD